MPQHGVDFESVSFRGVRGKGLRDAAARARSRCCARASQARAHHPPAPPDVVLGFGGFASFPGALMGVAPASRCVLHDANAVAGLANRVLAYGADRILLGFPGAFARPRTRERVEWVGNPLRDEIVALPPPAQRFAGRSGPLRLLVVGGSLGAQALNERVPAALALIDAATRGRSSCTRRASSTSTRCAPRTRAPASTAECVPFIDDMAARYAWADFVVCRGGALTVAELAAVGLGAIDRAAAGRDRRRAERERAVPGRRRRGARDEPQDATDAPSASPASLQLLDAPRALRDGASRARAAASATPPRASPTPASDACGTRARG